jgi:hypothetical protein
MKAGILTFHRAYNCGAVLQAWALATYIKKVFGFDTQVVDYGEIGTDNRKWLNLDSVYAFLVTCYCRMHDGGVEDVRRRKFELFARRFLPLSEKHSRADLLNMDYTHLIVGSDQVWNLNLTQGDKTYFLDFETRAKRVAYAASFGVNNYDETAEKEIMQLMMNFDSIAVREESGHQMVHRLTQQDVPLVVDPTLLHPIEDYCPLERKPLMTPNRFVLLYTVCGHPWAGDVADRLARERGLRVVHLHGGEPFRYHLPGRFRNIYAFGPAEFLWFFRHADCVVTNSFHGTVFSILNHKDMIVAANGSASDDRMKTLLESYSLGDRMVSSPQEAVEWERADWSNVDACVDRERRKAFAYLKGALA